MSRAKWKEDTGYQARSVALKISVLFSRMRYVAAYLLAVLGGNESPTSKDLKKILDSVGIETDDERLNKVVLHSASRAYVPVGVERWSCFLLSSVFLYFPFCWCGITSH